MHARNAMAGLNGGGGGGSSLGLGSNYNGGGSSNNGFGDAPGQDNHQQPVEFYRVEMLGSAGVGKQALVSQFRTSDCINAYDGPGKLPQCQRHLSCPNSFPFPPFPRRVRRGRAEHFNYFEWHRIGAEVSHGQHGEQGKQTRAKVALMNHLSKCVCVCVRDKHTHTRREH